MVLEIHFVSQFFQEVFRHHPFGSPTCQGIQFCFGGTFTDCCVRDQAERVALSHCTGPPFPILQVVRWPDTFTDCGNVMISLRHVAPETPFKFRVVRFTFISALEVGQRIFRAVSFTLCMMSARSWRMYNSFPCPAHGSFVFFF